MSKDVDLGEILLGIRLLQQSFDAFDEVAAARLALNRTDLRCLDIVLATGPLPAGELSAALKLSPAATTTVIDRLERVSLVARTRDPGNRRRVLVEATDEARAAEAEIFVPVGRAGAEALARYGPAELAVIDDFLTTARAVQQAQIDRVRGLT
ncbi:MarR family transcriptional regulator [Nocardia neocaledoniensis NBRC 108232]|nr:MarR family transcriptional regulator [Nocardia neocaledoniensis]GEM31380.1 MarR family transcriptional regulator [Nocardia neocaledoniensis NBRC 108232]